MTGSRSRPVTGRSGASPPPRAGCGSFTWVLDDELTTRAIDPRLAALLGWRADLLTDQPWWVLMPASTRSALDDLFHASGRWPRTVVTVRDRSGVLMGLKICRRILLRDGHRSLLSVEPGALAPAPV